MARPKGKLLALVLVFGAITVVTATGAFTTVEAERTAEVNVAGDANALLQIESNSTSPNGNYSQNTNGQFEIVLNGNAATNAGGQGINANATTKMDHVFNVTNQGTQDVQITATVTSDNNNINTGYGASSPNFYLYHGGDDTTALNQTNVQTISPGTTQSVGVYFDTRSLSQSQDLSLTITIEANAPSA